MDISSLPDVPFESLVGEHMLDGVDMLSEQLKRYEWDDYFTDADVIRFRLDGVVYCAFENPDDGYRSSMEKLIVSDAPMTNTFTPVKVLATIRDKYEYGGKSDVLCLTDVVTGKVVLEAGTDNTDDYYPSFVGTFNPEHMAINAGVAS